MVHEFGIMDEVDRLKEYVEYTPRQYDCVAVHDDMLSSLEEKLSGIRTYFHSLDRPGHGLAWFGITLIPPESLPSLYDAVASSSCFEHSDELRVLADKIATAMRTGRYMIHFGI
jgi:hypothetical protein